MQNYFANFEGVSSDFSFQLIGKFRRWISRQLVKATLAMPFVSASNIYIGRQRVVFSRSESGRSLSVRGTIAINRLEHYRPTMDKMIPVTVFKKVPRPSLAIRVNTTKGKTETTCSKSLGCVMRSVNRKLCLLFPVHCFFWTKLLCYRHLSIQDEDHWK